MTVTEKGRSKTVPTLHFEASLQGSQYDATMVIGKKASLEALLPKLLNELGVTTVAKAAVDAMIDAIDEKTGGGPSSTLVVTGEGADKAAAHHLQVAGLPSKLSRHNHPMAVHTLTSLACKAVPKGSARSRLVVLTDDFSVGPLGMAVAKAFPLFSMKTGGAAETPPKELHIGFYSASGNFVTDPNMLQAAKIAAKGAQLTARLVDSHPELLTTTQFSNEVQELVAQQYAHKVTMTEIVGKDLDAKGYGGLYGVGKAANCPPRLVILEYDGSPAPGEKVETVALVGKGIVFDTGGLALKVRCCDMNNRGE